MFVAVDIGNSNITVGLKKEDKWQEYRFPTHSEQPLLLLREQIKLLDLSKLRGVGISSVVPSVTPLVRSEIELLFGMNPVVVNKRHYQYLPVEPDNPDELGSDLLVNSLAASKLCGQNDCLIVDFGTALTYTYIDVKGAIKGVSIAPGINTALKALSQNAAQLPQITPTLPEKALGTDTVSAIKAGTIWGFVGQVSFMINKIKEENNPNLKTIATGGLSHVLKPLDKVFDHIDRHLTLNGIEVYHDIVKAAMRPNG
ncbi:MAG: type III pantothenate kinase [Cyclobacteriaceae bacterium]|nr:type III pantothenate kinase [Cyclobacteriaceae bacterium]